MDTKETERSEAGSVYKILTAEETSVLETFGRFAGSPLDEQDGFIHLSLANQVRATLARFFDGKEVSVVEFSLTDFGSALVFEESRDGELFPHLYGTLLLRGVTSRHDATWDGETHRFEDEEADALFVDDAALPES